MINFNKEIFKKALLAGFFSSLTIGVLTILTYKSAFGLFLAGSFGSSMVLLFGFPESPFAQPKNVFFWTSSHCLSGGYFCKFNFFANLYQYSFSCRGGCFFNDTFKYCASSRWWKPNNSYNWKCIL